MRVASLCSGYGGLELGLELAGFDCELIWYSEISRYACAVMEHRHPGIPNLGDLTQLTGVDLSEVDLVTAGFPCQPVSVSGRQEGIDDERWLVRDVVSVWRRTGARWLILENVSGLHWANNGAAFGEVVDTIAKVGATARWAYFRACDVGAPHIRERWFCVVSREGDAEAADADFKRLQASSEWFSVEGPGGGFSAGCGSVRDTSSGGRDGSPVAGQGEVREPAGAARGPSSDSGSGRDPADPDYEADVWFRRVCQDGHAPHGGDPCGCLRERLGAYSGAVALWEDITGATCPEPIITDKEFSNGRMSEWFVEWMMGLPTGHVCSLPELSPNQKMEVLGNGVVPQQAAFAIHQLLAQGGPQA